MDTVFFVASKLVVALIKIETWLLLLALLAFWSARKGNGRAATWASGSLVALILVIGILPVGDVLLRPMEDSFPIIEEEGEVSGIIVLGGGEDVPATVASGQVQLGEGGDRHMAALALAHRHPEARIVFAGGSGRLRDVNGAEVSEASIAERIFRAHGVAQERLLMEGMSRNTTENARLALDLARPQPGQRWLLLTSAFHMPRAVRSFQAAGWPDITPYPVDFRTRPLADGMGWNFQTNLGIANTALRELVGRAAYRATGR